MKLSVILLSLAALLAGARAQPPDNRIKPGLKVGDVIPDPVPEKFLTGDALFEKIRSFHDKSLNEDLVSNGGLVLLWQRRVELRDADYFLCLLDSSVRVAPGKNPRVLILFTPEYKKLMCWGRFTSEPDFAAGLIVNQIHQPHTYFVTVNQSHRFGGAISFEKYLIEPDRIRKLGDDSELRKIPDVPKE